MKLLFVSLGCDKNRVDSERMIGLLLDDGIELTDDEYEAEAIVINTCCFIGDAKEESINTILEMAEHKKDGALKALIVAGCLAQRYCDEIRAEIPEVDAVIGTNAYDEIVGAVRTAMGGVRYESLAPLSGFPRANACRAVSTGGHYAYLKIAEGCDKGCTYCVIPSVRGAYRSVPIEELTAEARELARGGARELILVAQETTLYGTDIYGEKSLWRLLDALNAIPELSWIRILYCYPEEIDETLIDAILRNDKVCHYLDIPVQHAADEVLRRMGRRTDRASLSKVIKRLRERIPDIALRTTVICGFPGETKGQHEELLSFIEEEKFDRLGAFSYSPEEGTPAEGFPDQVGDDVKEARRARVMELQEKISREKNGRLVGRSLPVLVEGRVGDGGAYAGRSYRDAPDVDGYVFFESDGEIMSGEIVTVRITGALDYDLEGELVGRPARI